MVRLTATSTCSASAAFIPDMTCREAEHPRQPHILAVRWQPLEANCHRLLPWMDSQGEILAGLILSSDRRSFSRVKHFQGFYSDDLSLYFAARRSGAIHTEIIDHRRDCHCVATGLEPYNIARSEVCHFNLRHVVKFISCTCTESAAHSTTIARFCLLRRPARLMPDGRIELSSRCRGGTTDPPRCRSE